jgi:hypothetical protein
MKRRDFLEASSAAATTPLFLEGVNLDSLLGDGGFGGLFGSDESAPGAKTDPVADRIDHPVPDIGVSVVETNDAGDYIVSVEVTDAKGWHELFVFADDGAGGGGPITMSVGESSKEFPTEGVGGDEYFASGTMLAIEALAGGYRGVYFARVIVEDGAATVTPAHEVPASYCWEPGFFGCKIDDPVQPDVETPSGEDSS